MHLIGVSIPYGAKYPLLQRKASSKPSQVSVVSIPYGAKYPLLLFKTSEPTSGINRSQSPTELNTLCYPHGLGPQQLAIIGVSIPYGAKYPLLPRRLSAMQSLFREVSIPYGAKYPLLPCSNYSRRYDFNRLNPLRS